MTGPRSGGFCGFSSSEPTPERTAFVRFRKALVERQLDKLRFDAITAQLKAKAIRVKAGTLVDATIIASASEDDGEAHWVKHKGKPAVHGFKAHVGADADTTLVEEVAITPANINDGKAGAEALPDDPGEVFADSAYIEAFNGRFRVECLNPHWFLTLADAREKMEDWRRYYNEVRPHSAIGYNVPIALQNPGGAASPSP